VAPGGAPLADFGQRLGAYVIDRLIISAVLLLPCAAGIVIFVVRLVHIVRSTPAGERPATGSVFLLYLGFIVVILVLSIAVQYLYLVTYQARNGQTIGKRTLKIKVVSAVDGGPMTVEAARKRWLVEAGCGLVSPLFYLDGLWQLWDQPYRQCWHDKWPKTVVVKVVP
jgi:uncharacterized RDD family membrane protein YckC